MIERGDLFVAVLFGAVVGSFANVCIYRLPRALSLVWPGSHCTRCGSRVAWYDNVPVLSFIWLWGKCRACSTPFGGSVPAVEALSAVAAGWLVTTHGLTFSTLYLFALFEALLIVSVIDLEHRIIPDSISIPGAAIGLAMAAVAGGLDRAWFVSFRESAAGLLMGAGILWGVGWFYERMTSREGIGMGDVKLLGLFGTHAGPMGVATSLFYGSLLGSIAGIFLILFQGKNRRYPIPFGPFLSLGFLIHWVWGVAAFQGPLDLIYRSIRLF